ncbi:MAG TPA: hypothetical protein VN493_01625 [Thermoanaerobaculia bacterium]|nr:hypothetical protein [Thermoanaerobaculia bacterium]
MEAEIRSGPAETSMRPLWHAVAALAAILPAAGAALATRGVINAFSEMAETGSGGIGTASIGIYEANRPLIVALVAATVLAGVLSVAALRARHRAEVFPGLWVSLPAPILACIPGLLLWTAEGFIIDVLADRVTGSVGDVSQRLSSLLIASFGAGVLAALIAVTGFIISLARRRSADATLTPAAVWVAMTVLLLGLAAMFYARSSYLYQAGQTGQL